MSGLVAVFDMAKPVRETTNRFSIFSDTAAAFRMLSEAEQTQLTFNRGYAAKFDTSSSLHKGIVTDPSSQSWLMAVGCCIHDKYGCSEGHLEKILKNYIHNGSSTLNECDGQFALVIYNTIDSSLSIVSDPAGLVGIYYGIKDECVFVSTSALAVASAIDAAPDMTNTEFWLRTGRLFDEMTLWKGVYRTSAGTVMNFATKEKKQSIYWAAAIDPELRKMPLPEITSYAHSLLVSTLSRSLQTEETVWSELTGGFDSRLVSMFTEQADIRFKSVCQSPPGHPDFVISRTLAEKKGWDYCNFTLPGTWGTERLDWLESAVGRADGSLDAVSLTADLWGYTQRSKTRINTTLAGGMGELCRTSGWLRSVLRQDHAQIFRVDRSLATLEHLKGRLDEVRKRYLNFPNSTEQDAEAGVYIYRGSSHEGAYLSAAMGTLRYLLPMALKEVMVLGVSLKPEWRRRSLLVRHILARYDPVLAAIRTTDGGPAGPIHPTPNFFPYFWRNYGQKLLGKAFPRLRPFNPPSWSYPPPNSVLKWRLALLHFADDSNLLDYNNMCFKELYDTNSLKTYLAKARTESFTPKEEKLLNRMITIEMSVRAVTAWQAKQNHSV